MGGMALGSWLSGRYSLRIPAIAQALERMKVSGEQDIQIRKIGSKKVLDRLLQSIPIEPNSDYYPVLDQNAARTRFLQSSAQDLISFIYDPLPVAEMLGGEAPVYRETRITPSRFFPRSVDAFRAMALRDYLLTGSFGYTGEEVTAEAKLSGYQFKKLFTDCGSLNDPEARLATLFNNFFILLPNLRPAEMEQVWQKLDSSPCIGSFSPLEKKLMALCKAAGRRDAAGMVDSAGALLEENRGKSPELVKFGVAARMLGLLSQGKQQEAQQLWQGTRGLMYQGRQPDILFRLLAAHAGS